MTTEFPTILAWLVVGLLSLFAPHARAVNIAGTAHNLSVSGEGGIRAVDEARVCVFCHAPHNASPSGPLWNRPTPGSTYQPYTSATAQASPGQPTGTSLLCLSCHDGTIALGATVASPATIELVGGVTTMPFAQGHLGTDLSDDHPISFAYTQSLAGPSHGLVPATSLTGPVKLDAAGQVQCTSCHDPHDDRFGKFLVMGNESGALCETCHQPSGWADSSHRLSPASWNNAGSDPWPHVQGTNVADNACANCHKSHTAGSQYWLLNFSIEEDNCIRCHNGNVASHDVAGEFMKLSIHPLALGQGLHDAAEAAVINARHVECSDCHNPHATNAAAGPVAGALSGVRGVSLAGAQTSALNFEYQLCFRCHADSAGLPVPPTNRQLSQTNTRLEFATNNPSHHAVAGPGVNSEVPSLIAPLTASSTIKCTDCHNNNNGPGAGAGGPAGPHGSSFPNLLERRYETADNTPEGAAVFALCYKCHDRNTVLNGGPEKVHKKHLDDEDTPCNVCHDPHGISATQGNSFNNAHLINFDTDVVSPSNGRLRFEKLGSNRGRCFLVCHGKDHDPFIYPD
jgi:predicted CXXCH cytochrome family protein